MKRDLKNIFFGNIVTDLFETWPKWLVDDFEEYSRLSINFFKRDREIFDIQTSNTNNAIDARISPPKNIYKDKFHRFKEDICNKLRNHRFILFHCTRLIDEEIADIRSNGLELSGQSLVEKKLNYALKNGFLDEETIKEIKENNLAEEHNRVGQICFFSSLYTLRNDKKGLTPLFCHWGGEMIYFDKRNDFTLNRLREIGQPCVVVVNCNIDVICPSISEYSDGDIIQRMIQHYLIHKGYIKGSEKFIDRDFHLESQSIVVIDIVCKKGNAELFEGLTRMSVWHMNNRNCVYV